MILLPAVILGWLTGWGLARGQGRNWQPPEIKFTAILVSGFLLQGLAFYFEPTRRWMPDQVASICLVLSQIILLGFTILNFNVPGMPILIFGLASNLLVILANGGFMPMVAESALRIVSAGTLQTIGYGERISQVSKDILLRESDIRFPLLADRFIAPPIFDHHFIFSLGDIWIALGAFLILAVGRKIRPLGENPGN